MELCVTNKLFRLLVSYVHSEIFDQFINNHGDCKFETFHLVNWSLVIDKRKDGLYYKI
jgi:hypothetical protein